MKKENHHLKETESMLISENGEQKLPIKRNKRPSHMRKLPLKIK